MYFRATKLFVVAAVAATAVSAAPLDLSGLTGTVDNVVGGVVGGVVSDVTGVVGDVTGVVGELVNGVVLPTVVGALNEVVATVDGVVDLVGVVVNDVLESKTLDVVNQLLANGGAVDSILSAATKEVSQLDSSILNLNWLTGTGTDTTDIVNQIVAKLGKDVLGNGSVIGLSQVNGVWAFASGTVKTVVSAL
ncbi:hypothetical protein EV175_003522 [Coemansia sp. RSA 1933]|nr:hypothetical protein EV175_003522 [Coemansia sp. RSA 1933]